MKKKIVILNVIIILFFAILPIVSIIYDPLETIWSGSGIFRIITCSILLFLLFKKKKNGEYKSKFFNKLYNATEKLNQKSYFVKTLKIECLSIISNLSYLFLVATSWKYLSKQYMIGSSHISYSQEQQAFWGICIILGLFLFLILQFFYIKKSTIYISQRLNDIFTDKEFSFNLLWLIIYLSNLCCVFFILSPTVILVNSISISLVIRLPIFLFLSFKNGNNNKIEAENNALLKELQHG